MTLQNQNPEKSSRGFGIESIKSIDDAGSPLPSSITNGKHGRNWNHMVQSYTCDLFG